MNVPSRPTFAAALSLLENTRLAVDEVSRDASRSLGGAPHLGMLFVSREHLADLDWIAAETAARTDPACLLGCVAEAIVGGARDRGPAGDLPMAGSPSWRPPDPDASALSADCGRDRHRRLAGRVVGAMARRRGADRAG